MRRTWKGAKDKRQVRRTQLARSPRRLDLFGQADARTLVLRRLLRLAHDAPFLGAED
jgi:hypothetical protein